MESFTNSFGFAKYCGEVFPFKKSVGEYIFLMDFVGRKGFNTIVVRLADVEVIKLPCDN